MIDHAAAEAGDASRSRHWRAAVRASLLLCAAAIAFTTALGAQSVRLPSANPLFVFQGGDTPNVNYPHIHDP